ncbi:hypothetical protein Syun_029433 [Stephania yunnanensis]|uniref:Uncharacterized protein n=1 Tax=Stephania yunnanensis TaxID=152371 RepID=A0AAP0EDN0_9MAGN
MELSLYYSSATLHSLKPKIDEPRWKSFFEDEDRPEKPRRYGVTEIRGPHYSLLTRPTIQLKSMGETERLRERRFRPKFHVPDLESLHYRLWA